MARSKHLYLDERHLDWNKPTQLFRHWLMHSYVYYIQGRSLIPDSKYDALCRRLLELIREGFEPPNRGYATEDALSAGTAFHISADQYPPPAISVAEAALRQRGIPVPHPTRFNGEYDERGMAIPRDPTDN